MKYECRQCKRLQAFKQIFYYTSSGNKYPLKAGPGQFVVECNVCGWRWFTSNPECIDRRDLKKGSDNNIGGDE